MIRPSFACIPNCIRQIHFSNFVQFHYGHARACSFHSACHLIICLILWCKSHPNDCEINFVAIQLCNIWIGCGLYCKNVPLPNAFIPKGECLLHIEFVFFRSSPCVCVFQSHSKLQSKQINSEKHVKNSLKWVLRDNPFITQEAIGFDCWWNMFLKLSFFTYRLCADLFKLSSLSSVWARIKLPYHKKGKKEWLDSSHFHFQRVDFYAFEWMLEFERN